LHAESVDSLTIRTRESLVSDHEAVDCVPRQPPPPVSPRRSNRPETVLAAAG
jgi:hypothetical protein